MSLFLEDAREAEEGKEIFWGEVESYQGGNREENAETKVWPPPPPASASVTPLRKLDRFLFWLWVAMVAFVAGSSFTYAFLGTVPPVWSLYTIMFILAVDGLLVQIRNRLLSDNNSFLRRSNEHLYAQSRKLQGRPYN